MATSQNSPTAAEFAGEWGAATCGSSAYRIDKIVPVRDLVQELVREAAEALAAS